VDLARLIPSGRAVVVTVVIAALGAGVYLLARETSLFALRDVDVRGAPPSVAAQVRRALEPVEGTSLVTLDGDDALRRVEELPVVASARYDRDFPHTLRLFVRPERPVAVVRRGTESWLVSARGRVMQRLARGAQRMLPRIWVPRTVPVTLGGTLDGDPAKAVATVIPLARVPLRHGVAAVRANDDELTLVLRSGLELRLGDERNLLLKLAVGSRIARLLGRAGGSVDLAVPGRPVSSAQL
jgi:cell division protein FtsQ